MTYEVMAAPFAEGASQSMTTLMPSMAVVTESGWSGLLVAMIVSCGEKSALQPMTFLTQ